MINHFRKNQRVLMLVVAILTIIAFAWLYDPNATSANLGSNSIAQIYGKNLSQADIDREVRNYSLALALQQFELISTLGGMAQNENMAVSEFIWNLQVLQHEARKLGVEPSDAEVIERFRTIPAFQTNGQFDSAKYGQFITEQLGPKGFTEKHLETIVRDSLRLERLLDIVGAPAAISPDEVKDAARIFDKVDVQEVKFSLSAAEELATVSEEEIQGFHARNKASLLAPETRSVEYVTFAAPGEEASTEVRQKLADQASAFADQAATSFAKAAASAGLTVQTTPQFDRSGALPQGTEGVDAKLVADLPALSPTAFTLTPAATASDVIDAGDRFYVINLLEVTPQRELTLEEVAPIAVQRIKALKGERIVRDNAEAAIAKVREAMAGGKTFEEAAQEAGLQTETFTGLDAMSETLTPAQQEAIRAAVLMQPGQLSGFVPSREGGFAIYLSSRTPAEGDTAARITEIEPSLLENKRRLLFLSWLASAREDAKITVNPQQR